MDPNSEKSPSPAGQHQGPEEEQHSSQREQEAKQPPDSADKEEKQSPDRSAAVRHSYPKLEQLVRVSPKRVRSLQKENNICDNCGESKDRYVVPQCRTCSLPCYIGLPVVVGETVIPDGSKQYYVVLPDQTRPDPNGKPPPHPIVIDGLKNLDLENMSPNEDELYKKVLKLSREVAEKDIIITELRSQLDKFQSVFPSINHINMNKLCLNANANVEPDHEVAGPSHAEPRRRRGPGISAEPQSADSLLAEPLNKIAKDVE